MTRAEAAAIVARAGCSVMEGVTKHTTILIVGDQDPIKMTAGQDKSAKHRKAEDLIAKGIPIRIVTERNFQRLITATP